MATAILPWVLMLGGGCRTTPTAATSEALTRVIVSDRDRDAGRFMRWEVDRDGTCRIGAGAAAKVDEASPVARVDDHAVKRLWSAIEAAGWLDATPSKSTGAGPRLLAVALVVDGSTRRFDLLADGRRFDPKTDEVVVLLEGLSGRRFDSVLDALPTGRGAGP